MGRALLDLILKKNDFPTIYITRNERSSYLNALREGDFGNYEPLINLVIERIFWTFSKLFVKTELYKVIQSRQFKEVYTSVSDYLDLLQTSKERPFHEDRGELFRLLSTPLELSGSSDLKYLHF